MPTAPLTDSAYELEISLPRDLGSALELMESSASLRKILGDEFINLYLAVKKLEYETFNQVITPWEREHLLLRV